MSEGKGTFASINPVLFSWHLFFQLPYSFPVHSETLGGLFSCARDKSWSLRSPCPNRNQWRNPRRRNRREQEKTDSLQSDILQGVNQLVKLTSCSAERRKSENQISQSGKSPDSGKRKKPPAKLWMARFCPDWLPSAAFHRQAFPSPTGWMLQVSALSS